MAEESGFVTIKDLAGAVIATEDDDLIIQQGEETKKINLKTLGQLLVFIDKVEQTKISTEPGGVNEITVTKSDGSVSVFNVKNGDGIEKIEQTQTSSDSSGVNIITTTLSDGRKFNYEVKNGVGIIPEETEQTITSTVNGDLNEFTFTLSDGSKKTLQVINGRGKDFRISATYNSIQQMEDDYENAALYDFVMIDTGNADDIDTGKLYCKEVNSWRYIGDLSGAQGIKGDTGVGVESISSVESPDDNGINIVTLLLTDGSTHSFHVKNGSQGSKGDSGASIINIEQTESSTESSGRNVITFTLEDGTTRNVEVFNGAQGEGSDFDPNFPETTEVIDDEAVSFVNEQDGTLVKRKASIIWEWIVNKLSSVFAIKKVSNRLEIGSESDISVIFNASVYTNKRLVIPIGQPSDYGNGDIWIG